MPTPADPAAWERLGGLLAARRAELDPRYANRTLFCEERGIDYRLAYDVEEARRTNFRTTTLAGIATAYAVTFGSLRAALHGGDLEPVPHPRPEAPRLSVAPDPAPPFDWDHADDAAIVAWIAGFAAADPDPEMGVRLRQVWEYPVERGLRVSMLRALTHRGVPRLLQGEEGQGDRASS